MATAALDTKETFVGAAGVADSGGQLPVRFWAGTLNS